jgi:hypothetical protein
VQQSPDQLRELVAPIALYPDPLIGQILGAATYPSQVLKANDWMQQHQGLAGDALAKEVDKQPWDPSVKALTEFPAVLANMSQNLAWTAELGDAYVNQQQELTKTIQGMRVLAKNAGNLTPTSQENVTTQGDTIDIEPTSADEVYVPQHDPWDVYGDLLPIFPGWSYITKISLLWSRPCIPALLPGAPAAVDCQDCSGSKLSSIRREIEDGGGDVFAGAESPNGMLRF